MIDPPWFKPAIPVLRLADTRADVLRSVIELIRAGNMPPLTIPRLTPLYGLENLDR
jgi:hypothetical protein